MNRCTLFAILAGSLPILCLAQTRPAQTQPASTRPAAHRDPADVVLAMTNLLLAGNIESAQQYFPPSEILRQRLREASQRIREDQCKYATVASQEDGDIAIVLVRVAGKDGDCLERVALRRKDNRWVLAYFSDDVAKMQIQMLVDPAMNASVQRLIKWADTRQAQLMIRE